LAATVLVTTSTFDYDTNARLTSLAHTRADDTSINTYTWTYDSLSRITSQGSIDGSSTYTYDQTSQLVAADHNFQSDEGYNYDANGNRTTTGYETGANNQLLSDGTFTYQYDAEGNRTTRTRISSDPADDYLTQYTWDHRNRLTSVALKNNSDEITGRVEYDYNVFNLMVARREYADETSTPIKSEHFIYDGSQIIQILDDSAQTQQRLLRGPAVDQIFAAEDAAGEVIWPLADHLNTVRDFVDSSGVLLNHRQFDSFGNLTAESNPTATDYLFTFTGGYQDSLSNLIYRWHRWFDAAASRWLTDDPIGFQSRDTNLQRYVANFPTNIFDPTGLNGTSPYAITWHHLVPQQLETFLERHGLQSYLHSSDNGWYIRWADHQELHGSWNQDWADWVKQQTGQVEWCDVEKQMEQMKRNYNLVDADGKPALGMPVNERDGMPYTDWKQTQKHRDEWRQKRGITLPKELPGDGVKGGGAPSRAPIVSKTAPQQQAAPTKAAPPKTIDPPKTTTSPKAPSKVTAPKTKTGGVKANCLGPLGVIIVPLSILKTITGAAADAKENGTSFWDELWENEVEEPLWLMPGVINPNNPAFRDQPFRA
jgi:RHS repeat-associated protein